MGKKSAQVNGLGVVEVLKGHDATLRDCIEQLSSVESSRINLVSYLREALQEQVYSYPKSLFLLNVYKG